MSRSRNEPFKFKSTVYLTLRFLLTFGFANGESLMVDPKTGLIFSPVDSILIQNFVNISISIEASSVIDFMNDDLGKLLNNCVLNKSNVDISNELNEFSKKQLIQRIEGELNKFEIPFGTVASKTPLKRTAGSVKSKYQMATGQQLRDDPEAVTQIITESNYEVEFDIDDIYNEFELCFGRDLMSPKLDMEPETRQRLSHGESPTTIYQTGYLVKEEITGKYMNINIGKCCKSFAYLIQA